MYGLPQCGDDPPGLTTYILCRLLEVVVVTNYHVKQTLNTGRGYRSRTCELLVCGIHSNRMHLPYR